MRLLRKLQKVTPSVGATFLTTLALAWLTMGVHAVRSAEYTIGVTIWDVSSTPAAVPIVEGMKEAAKQDGVTILLSDPKWDASAQVDNIRDFVTRGVNAIAVFPIDIVGVIPAVEEAQKAGVPVVAALGAIEGLPYVGVDDLEYGRVHARLMLEAMKDIKGRKRIGIFRGTAGGSPDRLRMQGMQEVFKASGQDIEIESVTADWIPEKALTGFQDLLQRYPNKGDLALVTSMGNCMVPPSIDWAKKNGREEIIFTTMDLCKADEEAVQNGTLYGVAFQDVRQMGRLVIDTIVAMNKASDYHTLPEFARNPPIIVCTRATVHNCKGRGF
jgi:ABC-type sugar transport system substrate-binding protein